jgi:hypothetical protein
VAIAAAPVPAAAPTRRRGRAPGLVQRVCLVCGLHPRNGAGVAVLACQLKRSYRKGATVTSATLRIGLCTRCLLEAIEDGRLFDTKALRRATA